MKKGLSEIVLIMDRSGSMYSMQQDVVGGINSVIDKQKKEQGEGLLTLVQFNQQCQTIIDRKDLNNVKPLKLDDYRPEGCTALIDALGETIEHIETIHRYIRKEDVPENTIFVIMTDGLENASHRYSRSQVKKKISEKQKKGWQFIYLAANIDAAETAKNYGIAKEHTANFINDSTGNRILYESTSNAISSMRFCKALNKDWNAELNADVEGRSENKTQH